MSESQSKYFFKSQKISEKFSFFLRLSQKTTLIEKKKKEKLFADRFERDLEKERETETEIETEKEISRTNLNLA